MKNLRIGRRLALGFGLVFGMMALIAATGYWGLESVGDVATRIAEIDATLVETSAHARIDVLELRRYEKDYFLNVGASNKEGEYLVKWEAQVAGLTERLDHLESLLSDADKSRVRKMRDDAGAYAQGFRKLVGSIKAGELKTAQDANAAMSAYTEEVLQLDEATAALAV